MAVGHFLSLLTDIKMQYAGATNAVALCEHLNQWEMYRRTAEIEGILSLRERMRDSLTAAVTTAINNSDFERQQVLQKALEEWDHPDFLAYLKTKLGSM